MPRLKKRSLETKARISRMKRAEKRREQILYLKTQAEEMEILWYEVRLHISAITQFRRLHLDMFSIFHQLFTYYTYIHQPL